MGRREHKGAGRPPTDVGLRARTRYMAAPCDWPGCARARISRCRVARELPFRISGGDGMRIIGLDIHRAFAEAVAWENGKLRRLGRVILRREALHAFAQKLSTDDVVVIESTGNAASASAVIGPY